MRCKVSRAPARDLKVKWTWWETWSGDHAGGVGVVTADKLFAP